MELVLPKRIEERLEEESKRTEASEEELIVKALLKVFGEPLDPETKVKIHLNYLRNT